MRRKGFTLVELTVVIGVIMLLTSMLIPMVVKAHRVAIRSRMKADIGVIGSGRGRGTGGRPRCEWRGEEGRARPPGP